MGRRVGWEGVETDGQTSTGKRDAHMGNREKEGKKEGEGGEGGGMPFANRQTSRQ